MEESQPDPGRSPPPVFRDITAPGKCAGYGLAQPKPIERPVREPWEYAQPGEMNIEWMRL